MSQDAFFQEQSEVQPKLNPPIYRWQEDMPENNQPQLVPPQLIWLNTKNSIWMEVPRYEGVVWGGMILGAIMTLAIIIFMTVLGWLIEQELNEEGILIIYAFGDFFSHYPDVHVFKNLFF